MTEAALGLGTNLGDRTASLAKALDLLDSDPGIRIRKVSHVYRSAPWGVKDQPDFLNLCVLIDTFYSAEELLRACKTVEAALGRARRRRWGPREIDVDILLMDEVDIDLPNLTIPHAKLVERRFALEPLAEIAPEWMLDGIPVAGLALVLRQDAPDQVCEPDEKATQRLSELRGL